MGSDEGSPTERLTRAFLRALHDPRFSPIETAERPSLTAQVSYVRAVRSLAVDRNSHRLELGTEGVAYLRSDGSPVQLLPHVARDRGIREAGFLQILARKAGVGSEPLDYARLFAFTTEDIAARQQPARDHEALVDTASWLARLVDADGRVCFALDPRTGRRWPTGPMWHARTSVAVRALLAHGGHARVVDRATRWLRRDVERALRGDFVECWPDDPARVAGTLALVSQVGIDLHRELLAFSSRMDGRANPWHAAQVVHVLGLAAPEGLWRGCVDTLSARPWAPWTCLAALARNDAAVVVKCERPLVESLRSDPPHVGGVGPSEVPEIALTAITVEALAPLRSRAARSAVRRGRDFLRRWQSPADTLAAHNPALASGGFPASPIASFLRCDVSGHALLALLDEQIE